MYAIQNLLKEGKFLISDGAWGTLLQGKGLKAGECPELWNIENPDAVYEVAKSYVDAGSDMILTNSFGGSRYKLEKYGLENKVSEINRKAAEISKSAVSGQFVFGSVGPTGKILMMGETTEDELYEVFKEQTVALADGGADAILIETMSDLEEAKIAVKAAKENTQCEIICTMTFEKTVDGAFKSMMGVSPLQMVDEIIPAGADIIGANCGNGTEGMISIVKEIRSVNTDIPVLIHANAGMPVYEDGKTVFPETPEEMASYLEEIKEAGANIFGGCCGTTPEHIAKLKEKLKKIT